MEVLQPKDPDYLKPLRDATYMLQKKCHRPANPIPEPFKRETLKVCTKVLQWCFDLEYIGPEDIEKGNQKYHILIQEKLKELEKVERAAEMEKGTYCFAQKSDGTYAKLKRKETSGRQRDVDDASPDVDWRESTASGSVDGNVLRERCGRCACMGISDGDIPILLECASSWEDIEELDLRGNVLQDAGMQRLVLGLSSPTTLPHLQRLRVGGNESGPLGAQVLIGLTYLRKNLDVCAEWEESERGPLTREVHKEVGSFLQRRRQEEVVVKKDAVSFDNVDDVDDNVDDVDDNDGDDDDDDDDDYIEGLVAEEKEYADDKHEKTGSEVSTHASIQAISINDMD